MTRFYRFLIRNFRWLIYFLFFLHVENKECIPETGNFIILSNHINAWDPIIVAVSGKFYFRPMAKKELYEIPLFKYLLGWLGCIKVDRTDGARALALSRRALDRKETMLIFPEGTRSKDFRLLDFKAGAFSLSIKTNTPILPCQIIAPKGIRVFRKTIVRFGTVIQPEAINFGSGDKHYERAIEATKKVFTELRRGEMPE